MQIYSSKVSVGALANSFELPTEPVYEVDNVATDYESLKSVSNVALAFSVAALPCPVAQTSGNVMTRFPFSNPC